MNDIKALKQKIEEVRLQLNTLIEEGVMAETVYNKSIELDELIARYIELNN